MINITVKEKNSIIDEIVVSGHSGYSHRGTDIVCASVSCIAITTINAILKLDKNALKYEEKDGYLHVEFFKHDKYIDTLIDNMLELLSNLEQQYSKYIKLQ